MNNRFLIYSLPRQASTAICQQLSMDTGIENSGEIFSSWRTKEERTEVLSRDNYIVKLLPEHYSSDIDDLLDESRLLLIQPRTWQESISSWILPAAMTTDPLYRNRYWNIIWPEEHNTPSALKKEFDGVIISQEQAAFQTERYIEMVDTWIDTIVQFEKNCYVIDPSILKTDNTKIWNSVNEKVNHIQGWNHIVEQFEERFEERWKQIDQYLSAIKPWSLNDE